MFQLWTEVQLIKAVWIHNTNQKNIVTTSCGRSQQRDCVGEQPCTSRPLQLSSVSVSATCRIAPSTRPTYSLRHTNSPHQVPQCVQDSSVTFALQLLAAHSHLVHPLCRRSPSFSLRSNTTQVCAVLCGSTRSKRDLSAFHQQVRPKNFR